MIQTRRIAVPMAALAILLATLTLPAAAAHAAPASPTETSVLERLWQPLNEGLADLQAGVLSLFDASTTDPDLDTDAEIGRGADPNGIIADPGLGTSVASPHDPDGSN